ncbi:MAG: SDR family NAD(P)-dependent oxidoreductase, partial [Arenicellales bacterium]|nr:SDR family NAD(P)-dependent oxidoreductase [Arenicellales bacterium]
MPATGPLADKTIMVTGAAGTIGAAVSHQVAAAGGSVVLLDRQERALDRIYDQIMALGNAQPIQVLQELADLTTETVALLASQLNEEFGKLDGLVHVAGEPPRLTPLEHLDPEHWSRLISVQLHAPFLLTRGLLPLLRQAPQASVIFTLWHRLGHL